MKLASLQCSAAALPACWDSQLHNKRAWCALTLDSGSMFEAKLPRQCIPGKRLFATASDTHKHSIASGQRNDPGDAADVLHGLLEKDQVHHSIGLVVLCQLIIQSLAQLLVSWDDIVDWSVICRDSHEVVVQQRSCLNFSLQGCALCQPHDVAMSSLVKRCKMAVRLDSI